MNDPFAKFTVWHISCFCRPGRLPLRVGTREARTRREARKEHPMRRLWRDYGLGWALLGLFLSSWVVQTWTGWREFQAEQREHEQAAHVFGDDGYAWTWAEATFENWQSEFLQL